MNQIRISKLELEDRSAIFELLSDSEVMKFMGPRRPLDLKESEKWFMGEYIYPSRFVFRELSSNEVVGFCGVKVIDGERDFGYFLRRKYWGQGYGKLMCKIALEKLAQESDLKSLKIFIAKNNIASQRIALSLGWKKIAEASNQYEKGNLYQVHS